MSDGVEFGGWAGDELVAVTRARRRARAVELVEFHETVAAGLWAGRGFSSPSAWLSAVTGEPVGSCRRMLHLGDRLERMPLARRAFADGHLSESALGLLADAWSEAIAGVFARDEELLVDWAVRLAFPDARVVIETWAAHADPERCERTAQERYDDRRVHLSAMLDGMNKLDGLLDAEGGRYVRDAIRMLSRPCDGDTRTPAQRRADGLVEMARFVLQHRETPAGTKRTRPKIIVDVELDALIGHATQAAADGADRPPPDVEPRSPGGHLGTTVLTHDAVRRLACDAGVHRLVTAGRSCIMDYGRQTRSVSDALFAVLAERDGGCRFYGCEIRADFCDAHHALHWADDGETEPDNLTLLCWHHHHVVHEQHWSIQPLGAGHFQLVSPTGATMPMSPPRLALIRPA